GRKLPGAGDVDNAFAYPGFTIFVSRIHALLRQDVIAKVGEQHVMVAAGKERIDERPEHTGFIHTEEIALDELHDPADICVAVANGPRIGRTAPMRILFGGQSEDEHVFAAGLVKDLYVRSVESADRQGAVELQFHVAGS